MNPLPFLPPPESDVARLCRHTSFAPVHVEIAEPELHNLVHRIDPVETQNVAVQHVRHVRGEPVVAAGVSAVVLPQRARPFGHV